MPVSPPCDTIQSMAENSSTGAREVAELAMLLPPGSVIEYDTHAGSIRVTVGDTATLAQPAPPPAQPVSVHTAPSSVGPEFLSVAADGPSATPPSERPPSPGQAFLSGRKWAPLPSTATREEVLQYLGITEPTLTKILRSPMGSEWILVRDPGRATLFNGEAIADSLFPGENLRYPLFTSPALAKTVPLSENAIIKLASWAGALVRVGHGLRISRISWEKLCNRLGIPTNTRLMNVADAAPYLGRCGISTNSRIVERAVGQGHLRNVLAATSVHRVLLEQSDVLAWGKTLPETRSAG